VGQVASRFGRMGKACFLEFLDYLFSAGDVDRAGGEIVTAVDDFVAGDFDERDGLGVAWFEADGCSCCNV
jgi:hypothetical protein